MACSPAATTPANPARPAPHAATANANSLEPGQYRTTVTILAISIPGLTPAQVLQMQAQPMLDAECVTHSDLNDLTRKSLIEAEDGETCAENHMNAAAGRIEGAATCTNSDGDTRTTHLSGNFTATHFDMDAVMTGQTARGSESQHLRMTGDRIGDCPPGAASAP
jgi:hypothetical protein